MERRNVGMKGKSPKQGLTNAKDLSTYGAVLYYMCSGKSAR